jgi:hypothetical protein
MLLKRIKSSTDMVHFLAHVDYPLSVKGFLLRVCGTSATHDVSINDIGRVFLRRRGDVRVSADFDMLQIVDDIDFGYPMRTGNGAPGAYAYCCYIPRVMPGSKDVEYIEPDDNYTLEITFGAEVAGYTTGFLCELYADVDVGVCWYDLQILQTNFSYAVAGTYAEILSGENFVESMLTAQVAGTTPETLKTLVGSNITEITLEWGRNHGSGLLGAWSDLTTMRKRHEWADGCATAAQYLLACQLHQAEGEVSGALEDKLGIQFTVAGASYPIVTTFGLKFNQDKLIVTRAQDGTFLANKLAEKERAGHPQASAVIKSALGQV